MNDISNYRSISLLPPIFKIFEKIIFKQLSTYLNEQKLLYDIQYGFRDGHSTELASIELIDRITLDLDKGKILISIFLDLSKAFDTLDHVILLQKLNYCGIKSVELNLFKDYLQNTTQYVSSDKTNSDMYHISTGVPQGSILGPLLFIIYINALCNASELLRMIIYADDTTLYIGVMYRLKHMVPSEILLTIYNGLIKPHILYGLKCWGFNQEGILKLQKKTMRVICSSGYLSHSEPLFKKLNVLKIDGMFKLQLLKFCFDLINNNLPAYLINMSSLLQAVIYHHNIRQKRNYSVARVKHVFAQKCMRFCIPDILNNSSSIIPDKIKTHSRKGLSVYLKCFLVNEYNPMCLIPNCYICSKIVVS